MKRRILISVPRPLRDLEGHALLAYHLKRAYGHHVSLYHGGDLLRRALEQSADAVVVDYVGWKPNADMIARLKASGMFVILMPTAGLYPTAEGHIRAAGGDTDAGKLVDLYLAWGRHSARAVEDSGVMSRERIVLCGCARFDFYVSPLLALTEPRASFMRRAGFADTERPLIVWATNTNELAEWEKDGSSYRKRATSAGGLPDAEVDEILHDQTIQRRAHADLVSRIAKDNPSVNVLIKVHPLEDERVYQAMGCDLANIRISRHVPIRPVLLHADILLQRGCTTATEAWMLQKPVLELRCGTFARRWAPIGHECGNDVVETFDDAATKVREYLKRNPVPIAQRIARAEYLTDNYFRIDGNSALRAATAIDALVGNRAKRESASSAGERAGESSAKRMTASDMRWSSIVKQVLGIDRDIPLRSIFTGKPARLSRIDQNEVQELYRCYDRVFGPESSARMMDGSR